MPFPANGFVTINSLMSCPKREYCGTSSDQLLAPEGGLEKSPGSGLFSHAVTSAVS